MKTGDTIDLIVDCRTNVTSDSFSWEAKLEIKTTAGDTLLADSKADFHGPAADGSLFPGQVTHAWQLAYCRPPTDGELLSALEFLAAQIEYLSARRQENMHLQALTNLCQVLLSSNEFLYVE